jgi:hypothetical protein
MSDPVGVNVPLPPEMRIAVPPTGAPKGSGRVCSPFRTSQVLLH